MSNTLTNLIPTLYEALDIVSRELVGMIPAVLKDTGANRAALNQTVRVPVAPANTSADIVPAATGPDPSSQSIGSQTITITKSKSSSFYWEGEEEKGMDSASIPYRRNLLRDQFAQAMRVLTNEIEEDLAQAGYKGASRGYGTSGTTPFTDTTKLENLAQVGKILDDNGCPKSDRHCVIDTVAGVNLRSLTQLTNVNEAGERDLLRQGSLSNLLGFAIGESAGIGIHTAGDGASYQTDGAVAQGGKTITLDTGTGDVLEGDIVTFADESPVGQYVVGTGIAAPGDIVINNPGVVSAAGIADDKAMTIANAYTYNLAFHRNAIVLANRAPALPEGGDSADDRMMIQDPVSGLVFEVSVYRQYRRVAYEVAMAWGQSAIKEEHIAILIG